MDFVYYELKGLYLLKYNGIDVEELPPDLEVNFLVVR